MPSRISSSDFVRVAALLLAAGWGANHFAPLLLVYRARMGLDAVDLGVLFAVYALGLVPGLLVGGPLSDQRGRRAVVLPAALLALGGTALPAAGASGFGMLLAGRLVVGLGSGGVFSAGTAWVQDLSAGEPSGTGARRAAIALSCGFGGGPLIAGIMGQWSARPMLTPYLLHAAAMCAAIALAWPVPGSARADTTARVRRWSFQLPARFMRELGPVAPWVFAFPSIAFVVLPVQVRAQVGGFAVIYAGLVAAATLAAGIVVQPFVRPRPARQVAVAGLALGAAGLISGRLATTIGSPAAVVAAAVLLGGSYGCCLISGLRWIEATTPVATRGRATGAFYVVTYLGFWVPTLFAAVARHTGEATALLLTAALAMTAAAVTAFRPWRTDKDDA